MASIGELFVSLGIKGQEKTISFLDQVKKGLSDIKDTSFETKAALVGAMYALERLFAASGKAGTDLTNFSALMGGDLIQTLQQYQYAARQVGVGNEEVTSSFLSLQEAMTKLKMHGQAPSGMALLAQFTGGIGPDDVDNFMAHPELLFQRFQKLAARKDLKPGVIEEIIRSFGISRNMTSAIMRQAFAPDVLAKAPTYSNDEVKQLDAANIAWSNLFTKIEMTIGHLNAAFGPALVKDIGTIVNQLVPLIGQLAKLGEVAHVMDGIKLAFKGWADIIKLITDGIKEITSLLKDPKLEESLLKLSGQKAEGAKEIGVGAMATFADAQDAADAKGNVTQIGGLITLLGTIMAGVIKYAPGAAKLSDQLNATIAPNAKASNAAIPRLAAPPDKAASPDGKKVEINQNIHFTSGEGKDPQAAAKVIGEAVRTAARQSFALTGNV